MSQEARVRVSGPSRGVLATATGALVALTSAATAFVVLTGTGSVVPLAPSLEPLPPAAAPPARPPVVVLPPGALGLPVPAQPDDRGAARTGGGPGTRPFVLAAPPASVGMRALLPQVPDVSARPPAPGPATAPVALPETAPPSVVLPDTAPPPAEIDPRTVRELDKTLERRPGRGTGASLLEVLSADTSTPLPTTTSLQTTTQHGWDEQDEREHRHARSTQRVLPAAPAVVTGSRAIPAVPAAVAQQVRRAPAVVQHRPAGRQQPSKAAPRGKAGHSKAAPSSSRDDKDSARKKPGGEKKSSRGTRGRSGAPRS